MYRFIKIKVVVKLTKGSFKLFFFFSSQYENTNNNYVPSSYYT